MKKVIKLFNIIIFLIIICKANTTLATTTFNKNNEEIKCLKGNTITITAKTDVTNPSSSWLVTAKSENNNIVKIKSINTQVALATIVLECKESGNTTVTIDAMEYTRSGWTDTYSTKLTCIVDNGELSKEEALTKANEASNKYENDLKSASENTASTLQNIKDIVYFILGNAKYGNFFKTYNEENKTLVNKWENALNGLDNNIMNSLNLTSTEINNAINILNEFIKQYNTYSTSSTAPTATKPEYAKEFTDETNALATKAIEEKKEQIKQNYLKLYAESTGESREEVVFTDDVLDDPSAYNPTDPSSDDDSEAATIIDKILSLITTIGTVISVLMLAILGVKYMLGSVEEKADYKKDLVPYFIGAALLFGICTIVKILQSLGSTINNL
jgi:type IV secretory pathway VirB2 component (pilin)